GDGGDELFAGYQTYQAHKIAAIYNKLPRLLKGGVENLVGHLSVSHEYLSLDFKLKQFLKGTGVAREIGFFRWRGAFDPSERSQLLTADIRRKLNGQNGYEDIDRYINDSK